MALLAQKLNELSAANAEGLLTDDEYRLLRINAFERFSGTDSLLPPTEAPVVPNMPSVSAISGRKQIEFSAPLPRPVSPVNKHKSSVAVGVANFIRKATGRKAPPAALTSLPSLSSPMPSPGPLKRSFLPRGLTRKPSVDVTSTHSGSTSATREHSRSLSSSHKASLSVSGSDTFTSPPASPRTRHPVASSSRNDLSIADDIFEDGGLSTTKQIRQAIMETEFEGKKVIEAFDGLELTARVRRQEKLSPPLPSPFPSYLAINSASSPTRSTSPSLLSPERIPARQRSGSDVVSLRSVTSTPSISIVKSPTTRVKPPSSPQTHSPVPSSAASLKRKNSVSSVSSQTHSLRSTRLGMSHTSSLSRSTGHLPLEMVAEGVNSAETDGELADIRRRRQEVIDRYEARLEYLRARLKGAELHEKLLRK